MSKLTKLSGENPQDREDALNALFSKMPQETEVEVILPSKGRFYTDFGTVTVKPLLFEDEQRILMSKDSNVNPVNSILSKCIEGVNITDLLIFDKLYLLMKVREVSYGSEYNFDITCPKCSANIATNLDISKHLEVNCVEDELTDPRKVKLPVLGVEVEVRFPRVRDEGFLQGLDSVLKNSYRFVVSVDGQTDPVFISAAMKRFHIRDMKTISKAINRHELGVDPRFAFECPQCNHVEAMSVPLDANFFSMS